MESQASVIPEPLQAISRLSTTLHPIKKWSKTTLDPLSSHCFLVIAVSCGEIAPEYQGVPDSPPSSEVVVR